MSHWLKKALVAGLLLTMVPAIASAQRFERYFDRPGYDYTNFVIPNARQCQQACYGDPRCRAWAFVRAGFHQGPAPRCFLKHTVPNGYPAECCTSGIR